MRLRRFLSIGIPILILATPLLADTLPFKTVLNMGTHRITNVVDPVATQDAATKHYVDNSTPAGAALSKTDDTNVTLTLGGTPTTALLQASSLTLGWTGTLAASRGGTGIANYQAPTTKGDILTYSTVPTRLGVGTNDYFLVADSTATNGIKWDLATNHLNMDSTYGISTLNDVNGTHIGLFGYLTTKGDLMTYSTVHHRLGVGANGTVLVADSTATDGIKWGTVGSGGALSRVDTAIIDLAGKTGMTASTMGYWIDEFVTTGQQSAGLTGNSGGWINFTTGTGAGISSLTGVKGGVRRFTTGASAARRAAQFAGEAISGVSNGSSLYLAGQTQKWGMKTRFRITTAIDSKALVRVGTGDAALNAGFVIGVDGSVDTSNFTMEVFSSTRTTSTSTGVGIDTNWHDAVVWNDGTHQYVQMDGGTITQAATRDETPDLSHGPFIYCGNGATAATRTLDVDYVLYVFEQN